VVDEAFENASCLHSIRYEWRCVQVRIGSFSWMIITQNWFCNFMQNKALSQVMFSAWSEWFSFWTCHSIF